MDTVFLSLFCVLFSWPSVLQGWAMPSRSPSQCAALMSLLPWLTILSHIWGTWDLLSWFSSSQRDGASTAHLAQ